MTIETISEVVLEKEITEKNKWNHRYNGEFADVHYSKQTSQRDIGK